MNKLTLSVSGGITERVARLARAAAARGSAGAVTTVRISAVKGEAGAVDVQVSCHWTLQDELVVLLDGELDRNTVPAVRKSLLKTARNRRLKAMAVDLSAVSTLDTAGVAVLVELLRILEKRRVQLRLIGLKERTRNMVHLTRLEQAFGLGNDSH